MGLKKAAKVLGAVALAAILSSPAKMASQQVIFQPVVIEQDLSEKRMSAKQELFQELSDAFHDADLVFKGKCIEISIAYCGAVGDLCTSYVFKSDTFYKHPTMGGYRKDPVEHTLHLFYDVVLNNTMSRVERAIMNGGSNGNLYEPADNGIMEGDDLIVLAKKKDLTHNERFISYYFHSTKKKRKLLDDIVNGQAKKASFK